MWYAMVDLFFVWVGLVVGFADAFGDDLGIAFGVTSVLAISTLYTGRVLEEISAKCTAHDVVELLLDELVSLLLVHHFFLLANGSLAVEANIERSSGTSLLLEAHGEMDSTGRFQRKP
jgi:hypothetical protein